MALTKAQYVDQGRYDAGGGQINGNLYGSESWQGKAYTEGHRQGAAARANDKNINFLAAYGTEVPVQSIAPTNDCPACAAGIPVKVHTGVKLARGTVSLDGVELGTVTDAYMRPAYSASDARRDDRIDAITRGWITAALWSTGATALDGEELENLDDYEFSENAKKAARVICATFYDTHTTDVNAYAGTYRPGDGSDPYECAGHDLWLTANGHGCGFWDRGLGNLGKRLADACGFRKQFDHIDLYIADDGFVNLC